MFSQIFYFQAWETHGSENDKQTAGREVEKNGRENGIICNFLLASAFANNLILVYVEYLWNLDYQSSSCLVSAQL